MYHPSESPSEEGKVWSSSEEEGVWPPVWKPVEESPQYMFIDVYLRHEEDYYSRRYPPYTEEYKDIRRFIRQVRESRGYDVDCVPEGLTNPSPFEPFSLGYVMNCEALSAMVKDHMEFFIREINAQAKRHGEEYKFDKLVKVVCVCVSRTFLHTFTVKEVRPNPGAVKTVQATVFHMGYKSFELLGWRFKPQEASTKSA